MVQEIHTNINYPWLFFTMDTSTQTLNLVLKNFDHLLSIYHERSLSQWLSYGDIANKISAVLPEVYAPSKITWLITCPSSGDKAHHKQGHSTFSCWAGSPSFLLSLFPCVLVGIISKWLNIHWYLGSLVIIGLYPNYWVDPSQLFHKLSSAGTEFIYTLPSQRAFLRRKVIFVRTL